VTAFKSVVLDVDSTVSALEGIDWLAARRAPDVAARVEQLTLDAMESKVALEAVYGIRLEVIRPTRGELALLADAYIASALPGVREAVSVWHEAGVRVVLVSGGLRDAILPLATWLGIAMHDVHAVDVLFDEGDVVSAVSEPGHLARRGGKPIVVSSLGLAKPILAVGDGATDAELATVVEQFLAFTGVVRRDAVVARAAGEIGSFAALTPIVLGR
jgi:phosphoserine phosphatase